MQGILLEAKNVIFPAVVIWILTNISALMTRACKRLNLISSGMTQLFILVAVFVVIVMRIKIDPKRLWKPMEPSFDYPPIQSCRENTSRSLTTLNQRCLRCISYDSSRACRLPQLIGPFTCHTRMPRSIRTESRRWALSFMPEKMQSTVPT